MGKHFKKVCSACRWQDRAKLLRAITRTTQAEALIETRTITILTILATDLLVGIAVKFLPRLRLLVFYFALYYTSFINSYKFIDWILIYYRIIQQTRDQLRRCLSSKLNIYVQNFFYFLFNWFLKACLMIHQNKHSSWFYAHSKKV